MTSVLDKMAVKMLYGIRRHGFLFRAGIFPSCCAVKSPGKEGRLFKFFQTQNQPVLCACSWYSAITSSRQKGQPDNPDGVCFGPVVLDGSGDQPAKDNPGNTVSRKKSIFICGKCHCLISAFLI